jgi:hypothetical protein
MARGGKRPGAGGPKGTAGIRKKLIERLERRAENSIGKAVGVLKRARAKIFDGDAHVFLAWVYRNASLDLDSRIRAAGLALPYERPRLASTSVTVRHISDCQAAKASHTGFGHRGADHSIRFGGDRPVGVNVIAGVEVDRIDLGARHEGLQVDDL